jgi:hypothetical protein
MADRPIGYLAPEHRAGDLLSFGPWTDLWSLGATARALAGDELPSWLLPWVERCTAAAPGDRFASAARAADALRRSPCIPPGRPSTGPPSAPGASSPSSTWPGRRAPGK